MVDPETIRNQAKIPEAEAFARMDAALAGLGVGRDTVAVEQAQGRVLARAAHAELDLPAFDRSAMDGFAVRADDPREEYRVIGTLTAGDAPAGELALGQAIRIMTGAPLPAGAGRVIKRENTTLEADRLRVDKSDTETHVRRRAEDLSRGDVVAEAGTLLGVLELANLISCGVRQVEVARQPTVVVLSTGDELVARVEDLAPGKILDSNGPMLCGLCRAHGLALVDSERVPDDRAATIDALQRALARAELVILSGGVSMGDHDYVPDAFCELGLTVHFSRVAIKPGKPTVFATRQSQIVIGLPGNPVSAFVMFHLFVLRAAARLTGRPPDLRSVKLRLESDFRRRKAGRQLYMQARLTPEGTARPIPNNGSGHLAALLGVDGFVSVPAGVDHLPAGAEIVFVPLPRSC